MSDKTNAADGLITMLLATKKTPEICGKMLLDVTLAHIGDPATLHKVYAGLFKQMQPQVDAAQAAEAKKKYEQALEELKKGSVRAATFLGKANIPVPGLYPRVEIATPDGHVRFPVVSPEVNTADLVKGGTVYLDPEGAVVLGASPRIPGIGQEAEFLRRLPETDSVEVKIRDERFVLDAAQPLIDDMDDDLVKRGDRVLFCPRREMAFRALPAENDHKHRFVDTAKIPDVIAQRDIGKPHWALGWLIKRTDILLNRSDIRTRFDLRPRVGVMLVGPSGTGKTLTIRAYLREFKLMLAARTGRDDVGSRVIRVKTSDLLSPWFGETDKNIEELFDDILAIGHEEVETASGERIKLPVVMIIEECDAFGRRRGGDLDGGGGGGALYDRVLGQLLQRWDDPTDDLANIPLITVGSSNRVDVMDRAWVRRLTSGGPMARFGRLDAEGLHAVLSKKLKPDYPFASNNGHSAEALRSRLLDELVTHFYSPSAEQPLVEITLRDGAKMTKSHRHFFTGAIVEQGVSVAIDRVAFGALDTGDDAAGLCSAVLLEALCDQIENLADNLTRHNVGDYVDLPETARVAEVRRLAGRQRRGADLVRQ